MRSLLKSVVILAFFVFFVTEVFRGLSSVKPIDPANAVSNVKMPDVDPTTPPYDPCKHDPQPIECVLRYAEL